MMLSASALTNAWREILYRVLEGFETQENVSPAWLVNPATNRPLKLDLIWPQLGLAVRFQGLRGKQQRRRASLEEEMAQEARDAARVALCQAHAVSLVTISVASAEPKAVFRELEMALSRASRRVAQGEDTSATKSDLLQRLRQGRSRLADIGRQVKQERDLELYAELWRDRQFMAPDPGPVMANGPIREYQAGMAVEHTVFGPGVVLRVDNGDDDMLVTVDFVTAGERTFAASLVGDKLLPA
jgi:hypothetical protein